jgi:hypothetical protein
MNFKLYHNLVFIITLVNMKSCYHFLLKNIFLFVLFRYKKRSCMKKINVIAINMKTNDIT